MTFLEVVGRELRAVFSNISVIFVVFVGSLLYAFLYPTPYYADVVLKQKIVVLDLDNTKLSKDFIFLANSSEKLQVEHVVHSLNAAKDMLEKSEVYGQLTIPKGFESNMYKGVPITLLYRANASYFLIYGTIIEGLNEVGNYWSNQIKLQAKATKGEMNIGNDTTLVKFDSIPLFNPSVGYINYALAAIMVFILHQTLIAGIMIHGASQNKAFNDKKSYYCNIPPSYILLARILVFVGVYIILFLLYFGVFFKIYGIHTTANPLDFWLFAFMFIASCAAFGIFLSTFIYDTALPTQIILISSLPLVFMMGFIYPVMLLPKVIQWFIHIIPAYYGINGFIRLNQMGDSLHNIMPNFYSLALIFCVCFILSYIRFKQKMK